MYYYDLHCHTSRSIDSPSSLKKMVKTAKKRGLTGIAVTDHNCLYKGPFEINGVQIIPGIEISVNRGHLLSYFPEKELIGSNSLDVIKKNKSLGGFLFIAHPFRDGYNWFNRGKNQKELEEILKLVDGFEVSNASDSEKERFHALDFANKNNLIKIAGSDAHIPGQLGFSVVGVSEKLNKDNFKEVLKNSKIILRPESIKFQKDIVKWKRVFLKFRGFLGLDKTKTTKKIFFLLFVRNYLRIKNVFLSRIKFSYYNQE